MTTTMTTTLRGRRPLTCASTVAAASVLLALSVAAPAYALYPPPADLEPYTHPQRLVEVAPGRRLNLHCTGYGSPTVVLESGFGDSAAA